MKSLFPSGIRGLADSLFSGVAGAVYRIVGIDLHSTPGLIKVAQKLSKHSGETVTELCKHRVPASDGSNIWFSSESGKIWREVGGVYTLVHTTLISEEPFDTGKFVTLDASAEQKFVITDASQTGLDFTDEFTITAWIYHKTLPSAGTSYVLVDKFLESGNQRAYTFRLENSSGTFRLQTTYSVNGEAGGVNQRSQSFVPSIGNWYHVALTFSGGNEDDEVKFFVNGVQIGSTQSTLTGSNSLHNSTTGVGVGGRQAQTGLSFNGNMSRVMMWNRPLSSSEIDDLYNDDTNFDDTGLVAHWKFDGDGLDETANNNDLTNTNEATFTDWGLPQPEVKALGVHEHANFVFWATEDRLWRIAVEDLADWSNAHLAGFFANGDDTYHPMAVQNLTLFIGDKLTIAEVDENALLGEFVAETEFNIKAPERITSLHPFDVDLLVGTEGVVNGRVLRWDTVSESWSAEDDVYGAVNAFIKDDNYVYVNAGEFGHLYFYNGEKLIKPKRIPGEWSPTKKAKVNQSAVGYLLGIPVFGLSNVTGNPQLQGVYSLGRYSDDYPLALDLTFPVPSEEFEGVTIGAILVRGADIYVAWKDGEDVGIAKIDASNKYASAYIETTALSGSEDRHLLKTITETAVAYFLKPSNTGVTLSYKKAYENDFTVLASKDDTQRKLIYARLSVPKVANPQLKVGFIVSGNNAVEIEDVLTGLVISDQ